jgi:hypothetical protein
MRILQIVLWIFLASIMMGAHSCGKKDPPLTHEIPSDHKPQKQKGECNKNTDCVAIKVDCCDCNQGGKLRAVPKSVMKHELEKLLIECSDVVCLQMISQEPSCKQKAVCRSGHCVME